MTTAPSIIKIYKNNVYQKDLVINNHYCEKSTSKLLSLKCLITPAQIQVYKDDILTFKIIDPQLKPYVTIDDFFIFFNPKENKKTGEDTVGPVPTSAGISGSQ